ncbi:MAG: phage tail tape measure protein, partial [Pseudonocardiaceae bacterium]|nr:phage tail tape measure protein [Pseudonocardiaceae bacterium]
MATEIATAYVSLVPSFSGGSAAIATQLGAPAAAAGATASKKFGGSFVGGLATLGKRVGPLLGAAAIAGVVKSAVSLEAQFSKTMNTLQAATGAPAAQLDKLSELAITMGADTVFSANEAADAMLELAKSGISPATIEAGALQGTLTLAAAGELDMASAATVAGNALNTFGLRGKDMNMVAAALAGAANASTASVDSMAQALQQVGPDAADAGLSIQETTAALAAFENAGIKGSDAGTSLKTMLARLVPNTEKAKGAMEDLGLKFTNANGEFVSLSEMAGRIQTSFAGLSAEERTLAMNTIFGSDARRAATILMNEGQQGIRGYIKATSDQSAAEKMAAAAMKGTAGALESMKGSIETAML